MSALISVIIPTFNRAVTLPETIKSVFEQSCGNWELVIIDDGSNDNTKTVILKYLEDNRVKYYYQENQGVSAARNFGVEMATGDYIIFLDSDDIFYPDLIQSVYDVQPEKYDLICWQVQKVIDGNKHVWKANKLGGMYNFITATFFPGSICYKRQLFINAGGFDPKIKFGENYELGIRISENPNLKIKLINRKFLLYDIQSSARTSNSLSNRIPSHLHQLRKHLSKYNRFPREKAELLYIIGHLLEKKGRVKTARAFYKKAFYQYPFRLKSFLKITLFSILK